MAISTLAQEETKLMLFCHGTELEQIVNHRPGIWDQLIKKSRVFIKGN